MNKTSLGAAFALVTGLSACVGEIGGTGSEPGTRGTPDPATGGVVALARRLTPNEYANVLEDLFQVQPSIKYPGSYGASVTGFSTEPAINGVGEQGVEQILYAAEEVAQALAPKIPSLLPCAAAGDRACAETFLATYGRRAFRRTLHADERAALLTLYAAERNGGATFAEAVSVMTSQLLQMPAFLYIVEAPASAGKARALGGVELATRLSFHFWNSVPDDALLDKAEAGNLEEAEAVAIEAERLFVDPRSNRGFVRFFREWTETIRLTVGDKDPGVFDYLDDPFAASVNESFDRFVVDQVRGEGSLVSLLTTNRAFVDQNLASFFGLGAVSGWTAVSLPKGRYSGIMTQPGLLAALAKSSETSYVRRGKFVRQRILCDGIGTPPPDAMAKFADLQKPPDPTARDLSNLVRARGECAACHNRMDPAGLAFEHFDAMGDYRDKYASGKAIVTKDVLADVGDGSLEFSGPVDLLAKISSLPEVTDCFARQVFRYTASGQEGPADEESVERIRAALEDSDGLLARAFVEAVSTKAFLYRKGP
jgi:hypothetical protein